MVEATAGAPTRAFVIHPDMHTEARDPEAALQEAVALSEALPEIELCGSALVRLRRPHPGLLFGEGKIEELKRTFAEDEIGLVLIDGPVTPVQQRNLEKAWDVKILDRTGLILEIFADRARTREGVLQVELAALSYQRTRLVRAWTHLERQRGGLGFVGGPGETQIEADRRAIDEAIGRLKRQLSKVVKTRELHRASRAKVPYPVVALVGYTNAGKSTLFNRLTGAEVMVKDMLFATLDPTMRAVRLPTGREVILSDTVGFISDLPTQLVAAFRATLEEVLSADAILHVRDISHAETALHAEEVRSILADLGVEEDVPVIEVWNKIDLVEDPLQREALLTEASRKAGIVAVSALNGTGMEALVQAVTEAVDAERLVETLTLAFGDGRRRAWLHDQGVVQDETQGEDGFTLRVKWSPRQAAAFARL